MTNELQAKIEAFADEWLLKTYKEFSFADLQSYDFASDCYRDLSDKEKLEISEMQFAGALESSISMKF